MKHRDNFIDFTRGIIIIDMVIIHLMTYFPNWLRALAKEFDFAIEGFVFISGLMIGKYYIRSFQVNPIKTIKKLLKRSLLIIGTYYLMIFTIAIPYYGLLKNQDTHEIKKLFFDSIFF